MSRVSFTRAGRFVRFHVAVYAVYSSVWVLFRSHGNCILRASEACVCDSRVKPADKVMFARAELNACGTIAVVCEMLRFS